MKVISRDYACKQVTIQGEVFDVPHDTVSVAIDEDGELIAYRDIPVSIGYTWHSAPFFTRIARVKDFGDWRDSLVEIE